MKRVVVRFDFEGSVIVEVEADPNDDKDWAAALADTWANVAPEHLGEQAGLINFEILEELDNGEQRQSTTG